MPQPDDANLSNTTNTDSSGSDPRLRLHTGALSDRRVEELRQEVRELVQRLQKKYPLVDNKFILQNCTGDEPSFCWRVFHAVEKRAALYWQEVHKMLDARNWAELPKFTHGFKSSLGNYGGQSSLAFVLIHMEWLAKFVDFETNEPVSEDDALCMYSLLLPTLLDMSTRVIHMAKGLIEESERTWDASQLAMSSVLDE